MKVAFCNTPLNSGHRHRGVGTYTGFLLSELKKLPGKDLEIVEFSKEVPSRCDLVHFPFFDPFFLTLPFFKKKPTVVTVHDLTPIIFSEHFPKGIKGTIKWVVQKTLLSQAVQIITDSENSARDIASVINFPKAKISVICLAADSRFQPIIDQKQLSQVSQKYQINKDFFLYIGDINWNKNIPGLLNAFSLFRKNNPLHKINKLLLVGSAFLEKDLREAREIRELIDSYNLQTEVRLLGRIASDELRILYNLAYFYIQPSFYEGFGLPLLEAMSCGCPVLSSNKSSLPEIAEEAAIYFDPTSIQDMLEKIQQAVFLPEEKYQERKQQSLVQSRKFTWQKTAQKTLEVYEKILKKTI